MRTESEPQSQIKMGGIFTGLLPPEPEHFEVSVVEVVYLWPGKPTYKVELGKLFIRRGVFGVEEVPQRDPAWQCPD